MSDGQRPDGPRPQDGDPDGSRWRPGDRSQFGGGLSWWWILIFALFFLPSIMRLFTGPTADAVTISGNRVEGRFDSPVSLDTEDEAEVQRGQGMFGVGKSKAKLYDKAGAVETTLDDVAGLESAKEEVNEILGSISGA